MNLNRELHEALGYCKHEPILGSQIWLQVSNRMSFICSKCGERYTEDFCPDYVAEPWLVIREMEKRGCLDKFICYICSINYSQWNRDVTDFTKLVAIDTTGKLAQLALKYLDK